MILTNRFNIIQHSVRAKLLRTLGIKGIYNKPAGNIALCGDLLKASPLRPKMRDINNNLISLSIQHIKARKINKMTNNWKGRMKTVMAHK